MAEAVALAKLRGTAAVARALGTASMAGRFNDGDLRSILDHQLFQDDSPPVRSRRGNPQPATGHPAAGSGSAPR